MSGLSITSLHAGGVTTPITCPTGTLTLAPGAAPATSYDGTTWTTTLPADAGSTSYSTLSFLSACTAQLPANTAVRGHPARLLKQSIVLGLMMECWGPSHLRDQSVVGRHPTTKPQSRV